MISFIFCLALLGIALGGDAFMFTPDTSEEVIDPRLPTLYDIPWSQTLSTPSIGTSSYWTSSHITATNGHQYLLLSHIVITLSPSPSSSPNPAFYCASILDLTNTSTPNYHSYVSHTTITSTQLTNLNLTTTAPDPGSDYDSNSDSDSGSSYGFVSLTPDKLTTMQTWTSHPNVTFNVTFEATTPALINGGTGSFTYGDGPTHEWALPGCRTTGSLVLDGGGGGDSGGVGRETVTIIPERSVTWYDRQWGRGMPGSGNWTWFGLHFHFGGEGEGEGEGDASATAPATATKASIWVVDNAEPWRRDRFATVRVGGRGGRTEVLAVECVANMERVWRSKRTGVVYPLEWDVEWAGTGGGRLRVRIPGGVEDQEMVGVGRGDTAYEGFVVVEGWMAGREVVGFGVVEMATFV
ncbi:hypothetical protein BO70DRAFT_352750 [Aspergillus heteromorphus CBS 117.55]|uniref:AttH domain-containing protein n=1 Tax=Aspergillus heteromorphus CBS 117.55 TaxID=1448321 RepID=A0A317W699_9EURO|nr:uncharacterized protein BO70DRAFT_352750 [Aspergillus heteromorphus CBS 117.55]PWY82134.1 hypothetical protein BO70DRAFT_352750 [Aspergillus heteromorphus CBS 117.55]